MTSIPTPRTPRDLLAKLRGQLPAALPTTLTAAGSGATPGNDLYEAYLFALVIEAAKAVGYTVDFETSPGVAARQLHLRRSSGRISSSGRGAPFTYAVLSYGSRPPLELHTGVFVVGKSKVAHEADVLLLPRDEAERCRRLDCDPASSKAQLVVEAKYYTKPVHLGTSREFLGLSKDLSSLTQVFVCTIGTSSATALLAGSNSVEYDAGVLPFLPGEESLRQFLGRLLRAYRDRR